MKKIKTHARTKISASVFMIIIFTLGFLSINLSLYTNKQNFLNDDPASKDFTKNLKLSGSYSDIMINDLPGNLLNWTWARTQQWCTQGTGTSGDPYIIEGHTFNSTGGIGPGISILNSRKHFIIRNCIFRDAWQVGPAYYAGIHLQNTTNGLISNNDFFDNPGGGVYLFNSSMNTVSGNRIYDSTLDGIGLNVNSSYNVISGNTIYNNSRYGIRVMTGEFNELSGNIVYNHTSSGIYLMGSYNNTLMSNTIYDSKEHGILCYRSNDTTIESNNINNNKLYGILLNDSNYAESYENWIYDNGEIGINCTSSSGNNQFYENVFLRNQKHAVDDGSNNFWNSTTIGNYWDNLTGPDANPVDGIVDAQYGPYNISGSAQSKDYLPIAEDGAPRITILSPNDDVFNETAPDFTLTIAEDYLVSRWYKINNSATNYPFTSLSGIIDQTAWDALSDGNITLTFYASDLPGNIGNAQVVVQKDTLAPVITIYSPVSGDVFGTTPPTFNMTITDPNLETVWYTIEDRTPVIIVDVVNFTIPSQIWNFVPEGTANVTFYANDTLGHLSFQWLILSKNITGSVPDFWIGLDYFIMGLFITLFSGIAISSIIIKIYHKKQIFK